MSMSDIEQKFQALLHDTFDYYKKVSKLIEPTIQHGTSLHMWFQLGIGEAVVLCDGDEESLREFLSEIKLTVERIALEYQQNKEGKQDG